ncbi:SpoVT/AbrB-like [Rhodopseudomonas palustris HaA2]|uniref:SpoVT/AbrB-like n=1 Tax=Rhodopseudomonas palustris (strain HaA2) TaxID=316058 RepID=Q2IRN8_RHOP2|nr:SpoVT/AbrB-like [Rhodopseudomonas palustris HaA2]
MSSPASKSGTARRNAKGAPGPDAPATAKLFMHGRSQAVRLPKEFRFEGTEVRVRRVGDKVILEPMEKKPFDYAAWRARLDALGARDFLADGMPDDPSVQPEDFGID